MQSDDDKLSDKLFPYERTMAKIRDSQHYHFDMADSVPALILNSFHNIH